MHINSIGHIGGEVIGYKPLEEDGLKPYLQVEAGNLVDGLSDLGKLPSDQYKNYRRRTTYGLDVIRVLAEKHFRKLKR